VKSKPSLRASEQKKKKGSKHAKSGGKTASSQTNSENRKRKTFPSS